MSGDSILQRRFEGAGSWVTISGYAQATRLPGGHWVIFDGRRFWNLDLPACSGQLISISGVRPEYVKAFCTAGVYGTQLVSIKPKREAEVTTLPLEQGRWVFKSPWVVSSFYSAPTGLYLNNDQLKDFAIDNGGILEIWLNTGTAFTLYSTSSTAIFEGFTVLR